MGSGQEMTALTGGEEFAAARRLMVQGQITPNGVTDPLLLRAMDEVPRERFVPAGQRHRAYADEAVPLGGGRFLLAPMVLARMLQQALPQPGERALVLASGMGYGAAILARMGLKVLCIEADPAMADASRTALDFALPANRPEVVTGDPRLGAPAGAPFRLILIEGAVPVVPSGLATQLGEGGRLLTIRREAGRVGRVLLLRRAGGTVSEILGLDAAAPLLSDFLGEAGFIF